MPQAPARLGRYELVARLAAGGMGEIFLARLDGVAGFEKLYAIKRILPHLASDPRFRKMMIAEAQISSKMSHANICQVYELDETADGELYIVMEYLEGISLLPLLRKCAREQTPLAFGFVASVLGQICDGLHYAHELRDRAGASLNVIHRDISPANVFVTETGMAKVLDFGISKMKDTAATQTDTVKGKFAYMAPEQLQGKELTRRVDIFALGILTYELLALRRLFQRKTDYLTFRAVMEQPIADLRRYRPDVPDATFAAVMKALSRDPADRFESAREYREALFDHTIKQWSADQLGELVSTRFSNEIGSTSAGVATALSHKGPPLDQPLIAPGPSDEEEDYEFLAVETDIETAPPAAVREVRRRAATEAAAEATDVPSLGKKGGAPWLLVVLALAVVAGGAGVLVLLWQRGQPVATAPVDAARLILEDNTTVESKMRNQEAVVPYNAALSACAAKHPSTLPSVLVSMQLAREGTITRATFKPPEVERQPLGACLLEVLRTVPFPPTNNGTLFSLTINLPQRGKRK